MPASRRMDAGRRVADVCPYRRSRTDARLPTTSNRMTTDNGAIGAAQACKTRQGEQRQASQNEEHRVERGQGRG